MSNWPQHSDPRPERAAHAPYNFVPLPEKVIVAEDLPPQDRYWQGKHTGWLQCELTTASPLYIRAALEVLKRPGEEKSEFERSEDAAEADRPWREQIRNKPDFFYTITPAHPVIPGSSLRGMLRNLIEIVTYSKVQWVTDQQRYFFRAVAAPRSDPLAEPYREALGVVKAGYVVKQDNEWFVVPVKPIQGSTFLRVKAAQASTVFPQTDFNAPDYQPAYVPVSFTSKRTPKGRIVVGEIASPKGRKPGWLRGQMVCSGSMLETGTTDTTKKGKARQSPRKNHYVVPVEMDVDARGNLKPIRIDEDAVRDYRAGLSDFQKQAPFDAQWGCLIEGRPIFYLQDPDGIIRAFGHSPNFRVPYRRRGAQRASSPLDYVPEALRRETETDLSEAIFGYTVAPDMREMPAYAGRVFFSDAHLADGQDVETVWLSKEALVPKILASPKPTTFQHYLVQPTPNQPASLTHYASPTPEETVIRGHKLYWHHGKVNRQTLEETGPFKEKETQHTQTRPVKEGVRFVFTIRFENLSDGELGALLWVLEKAQDDAYRLKLGMGKPYGLGAVSIAARLHLLAPAQRYTQLFAGTAWYTGEQDVKDLKQKAITTFTRLILDDRSLNPQRVAGLESVPRIQSLLALLAWPGPKDPTQTEYMLIEHPQRGNEYKNRPVLPKP
jgi:CRISPR-associated protein (TIGR03986 family)